MSTETISAIGGFTVIQGSKSIRVGGDTLFKTRMYSQEHAQFIADIITRAYRKGQSDAKHEVAETLKHLMGL